MAVEHADEGGRSGAIRALSRGLSVLKAINHGGSLTMMEIAVSTGVPYPTACRIVQTLLDEGMVEREPDRKRYRPTALVQTLSSGYQIESRLVVLARPRIVALTNALMWPISVSTRVGINMMVRDSTHALTPLAFHIYYPGYTLPMLESSSGRAYLAFCPDDERSIILRALKAPRAGPESAAPSLSDETPRMLSGIRQNGFATHGRTRRTESPGKTSSISVPVVAGDHISGTLTLIFFASAMKMEEAVGKYVAPLKKAASELSEELAKESA